MLKIDKANVEAARSATSKEKLIELLQSALQLEHATIPPYLTAVYSFKPSTNLVAAKAIKDIAEEEMLHMAMVANIITALGGEPQMAGEGFVPEYPGRLPLTIGDGLEVGLKKFSKELVNDVFMEIEKPETPLHFPVPEPGFEAEDEFETIGALYSALAKKISELGDPAFTGDPDHQVVMDTGSIWQLLTPVTNVESAVAALNWIAEDGEGTAKLPFDGGGEDLAHYYKFAEIFHGRKLVKTGDGPEDFAYAGDPIEIDEGAIWDLPDNPRAADYAEGTQARAAVDYFNRMYSEMLRALQRTFNGEPEHHRAALGVMLRLRTAAVQVVSIVDPATGKNLGLTFEYVPEGNA